MGAALELLAVPTLMLIVLIFYCMVAELSVTTAIMGCGAITGLLVAVIILLREEKDWEGPREDHEQTR